jgi:beta-glucanase (GH16 family)
VRGVLYRRHILGSAVSLLVLGIAHTGSIARRWITVSSPRIRLSASRSMLHAQLRPGSTTIAVTAELTTHPQRDGYYIDYGRSPRYGLQTPVRRLSPVGHTMSVRATLRGLRPRTRYWIRVVAVGPSGAVKSRAQTTMTTLPSATPASTAAPTGSSSSNPGPAGIPGTWSMIFDDEFDSHALDASKWSTGWFGPGITRGPSTSEQECYDPSQVSVSDGALDLSAAAQTETCAGISQSFTSGLISTNDKFQFTYGAMEARIWMPGSGTSIADWPAFWADGQDWPADGEIDVVEGLSGSPCFHFEYPGNNPGGCSAIAGAASGWHTYAADWEPGIVTFYYDGRVVGRVTSGVTAAPMYLILNLALASHWGLITAPASMKVDYVRVWQH